MEMEVVSTKEKKEKEQFHVFHKVPSGDGPYVRAKHVQVIMFIIFFLSIISIYVYRHVLHSRGVLE